MPIIAAFDHDPDETLDYSIDWTDWLPGSDTISSSDWDVPAGITKETQAATTKVATVWLSGGTDGAEYKLTNTITTVAGRTAQRTIQIKVDEK